MELALLIYVITMLPQISHFLVAITISLTIVAIGLCMVWAFHLEEPSFKTESELAKRRETVAKINPWLKKVITWMIVINIINIAIPSERTAYMMVGGYLSQSIAQSEQMEKVLSESGKISNKILTIINSKLDTYVDEAIKEVDTATSKTPTPSK